MLNPGVVTAGGVERRGMPVACRRSADLISTTDEKFARIAPHPPNDTRGKERVNDRRVISGIVHALKSGGRWTHAPREIYGPKKTLCNRFVRWAAKGF